MVQYDAGVLQGVSEHELHEEDVALRDEPK